jgi:hypothetical protein
MVAPPVLIDTGAFSSNTREGAEPGPVQRRWQSVYTMLAIAVGYHVYPSQLYMRISQPSNVLLKAVLWLVTTCTHIC